MKESFIGFLKEHDAYERFVKNLEGCGYNSLDDLCTKEPPCCWVSIAFIWDQTPEGRDYWDSLDAIWSVLEEINSVK